MTRGPVARTRSRWLLVGLAGVGMLVGVASLPLLTRQGINYRVRSWRIPLYLKAADFLARDAEYRRLAAAITRGCATPVARATTILQWTRAHIPPTPRGWSVIDDHTWHIITRGYGEADQAADVFTTLTTYAGMPAFWKIVKARAGNGVAVLSFVNIDERWTVWDVRRGFLFRNARGAPASVEELRAAPELVEAVVGTAAHAEQPYRFYVEDGLASMTVPAMLRAHQQMPDRRLLYEWRCWWNKGEPACNETR